MLIRGACLLLILAVGLIPAACLCVSGEEALPGSASSVVGCLSPTAHTHSHSHEEGGGHEGTPHSHEECSCAGSGIDMFFDLSSAKVASPHPVLIDAVPHLSASFDSGVVPVRPPKVTDTGPPGEPDLPLYLAFRNLTL